jgi:two-component system LytT family response regulator
VRVLIVDDEQPARDKLRRLLPQALDGAALAALTIGEARDGVEALAMVESTRPDVVFLDIQMPEVSGLEVAASLPAPAPLVVFVTAFDQYAVPAFDANAIDYLLKPYDLARLQRALARIALRLAPAAAPATSPAHGLPIKQLLVSERGVTRVVRTEDIAWLETADNYVVLHCSKQQPLLRQSMAGLLDSLGPRFLRCHRRAAVQLSWVEKLVVDDKGDGEVLLRDGATVPLSRQYRASLVACLQASQAR